MKREMMNMIKTSKRVRPASAIAIIAICAIPYPMLGQQSSQPTFSSAAEATQCLLDAVQRNDEPTIQKVLGASTELTSSRDPGQDKAERELFVQKYQEMHRLHREADGSVTLYIGAENWPFPIPLVQKSGAWRFDADAGAKEITYRRIGENEWTAIATCNAFAAAEKRYRTDPTAADPANTSSASLVAKAASGSDSGDPILLDGYYYRVLSRPAAGQTTPGFALIAYPAEYRSSGVMTFVVTGNGRVYEKDLGANTTSLANGMTAFHKDATWRVAAQ